MGAPERGKASSRYRVIVVIVSIAFSIGVSLVLGRSKLGFAASLSDLRDEYAVTNSARVALSLFRLNDTYSAITWMMHIGWLVAFLLALGLLMFDDMPKVVRALPLVGVILLYLGMLFTLPLS